MGWCICFHCGHKFESNSEKSKIRHISDGWILRCHKCHKDVFLKEKKEVNK